MRLHLAIKAVRFMTQTTVGIRELKAHLSSYVQQAKSGASVIITERGTPVARIVPIGRPLDDRIEDLVEAGLVTWSGRKLSHIAPVARTEGQQTVADLLLEDRE
jgi:prevent-host-death family protein